MTATLAHVTNFVVREELEFSNLEKSTSSDLFSLAVDLDGKVVIDANHDPIQDAAEDRPLRTSHKRSRRAGRRGPPASFVAWLWWRWAAHLGQPDSELGENANTDRAGSRLFRAERLRCCPRSGSSGSEHAGLAPASRSFQSGYHWNLLWGLRDPADVPGQSGR